MYLDFRSDNTGPIAENIIEALIRANIGCVNPYGQDSYTKNLTTLLTELTGREVKFLPCITGSACNMLALTMLTPKHASVVCHRDAHIAVDEASGPEYFLGGKLVTLDQGTKVTIKQLAQAISNSLNNAPHSAPIKTLCITQPNEWGLIYTLDELKNISHYCRQNGIKIHIDGARLHNALAYLNVSLKGMIDACNPSTIALGPTKNGGMSGDILLILENNYFESATYLHKKFGQLSSKSRFLSAGLLEYFKNDYWLDSSAKANMQAQKLEKIMLKFAFLKIIMPVKTNQVFVKMDQDIANHLAQNNVLFYKWHTKNDCYRFVTTNLLTDHQLSLFQQILDNIRNKK